MNTLPPKTDPHPWAQSLADLHAQVWTRLIRGVRDRRAPARHPTLATISPEGLPQARTVVLRAADKPRAMLDVHTDLGSAKIADLRACPHAALHVWDDSARLQIRLALDATILTGADVADAWARVPAPSRAAYGRHPAPGAPLAQALAYDSPADPTAFAVLHLQIREMDILHLGPAHRRARFTRATGWQGQWVAP
ncbi:MAG: pyridoxamine 5'-phosphate oxidase family protein [Roseinatronobacter sp.]